MAKEFFYVHYFFSLVREDTNYGYNAFLFSARLTLKLLSNFY